MNTNEFSSWERQMSADRITRSGTRICKTALVICYLIAFFEMCVTLFDAPLSLVIPIFFITHVLSVAAYVALYLFVTDILPSFWRWLKGY